MRRQVHPRVCGELGPHGERRPVANGSSPRVRGTPMDAVEGLAPHRFIPACAGNSLRPSRGATAQAVHPRVCGELASRVARQGVRQRFIPACAGNSSSPPITASSRPVHPRVCGELREAQSEACRSAGSSPRVRGTRAMPVDGWRPSSGSSPRVRGTRVRRRLDQDHQRFIPACAGNSL